MFQILSVTNVRVNSIIPVLRTGMNIFTILHSAKLNGILRWNVIFIELGRVEINCCVDELRENNKQIYIFTQEESICHTLASIEYL